MRVGPFKVNENMMAKLRTYRSADVKTLLTTVAEGYSVSIVGLSNVGKSTLLRTICRPDVQAEAWGEPAARFVLVYVDFNLMLNLTAQGFYEVTMRAMQETVARMSDAPASGLDTRMNELYRKVVEPSSEFIVPVSFSDAVELLSQDQSRHIVLLLDEFDDPFAQLDSRVFLNLRALSDKFGKRLSYVVATTMPLKTRGNNKDVGEFVELFVENQHTLGMLPDEEGRWLAMELAQEENTQLDDEELNFVVEQAGGHPGLIRAVTRVLLAVETGIPAEARSEGLALARAQLEDDLLVRTECSKLWNQLTPVEQDTLIELVVEPKMQVDPRSRHELVTKGLLRSGGERLFCAHFAGFVHRQRRARRSVNAGVWVDVDAGEVIVDGRRVPTLTELEYRLLLLLWGRLDKLCDKYQIVESVWGQDYIDEVDDARVEKLISRLRSKLEEDAANPRYLQTVRGRGYKLSSGN
jgi:DNA-binding winged helix-turn-helix (wHTH) protein